MEWNVTLNGKEAKRQRVKLPDAIPDNAEFELQVNGRTVKARWQRTTKALYILDVKHTGDSWTAIHTRTKTVSKFPGESDLSVNAEFTPAGAKHTQCMDATVALYIPGQEGREGAAAKKPKVVRSQITGKVLKVFIKAGDTVKAGDTLLIVEAMKMENRILAISPGVVETVKASEGDTIATGAELVRFKTGDQ